MKKVLYLAAVVLGMAFHQMTNAQVNISINIGNQPQWGPYGYNTARYYYLPELNMYYDIQNRKYIYQERRAWVTSRTLPYQYRNFNLYNTYKVVVNTTKPWNSNTVHQRAYARYKNDRSQVSIRDYQVRNNRSNDRRVVTPNHNSRNRDYVVNNNSNGSNTRRR